MLRLLWPFKHYLHAREIRCHRSARDIEQAGKVRPQVRINGGIHPGQLIIRVERRRILTCVEGASRRRIGLALGSCFSIQGSCGSTSRAQRTFRSASLSRWVAHSDKNVCKAVLEAD